MKYKRILSFRLRYKNNNAELNYISFVVSALLPEESTANDIWLDLVGRRVSRLSLNVLYEECTAYGRHSRKILKDLDNLIKELES